MATAANSSLTLSFHKGSGQYCKTINGKRYYLGPDFDQALEIWIRHKADFAIGVDPRKAASRTATNRLTLRDASNLFLERREKEISPDSWRGYKYECLRLIEFFGGEFPIANLTASHFLQLRQFLESPSPVTTTNRILRIKAFFHWLADREYIAPLKFGPDFKPPGKREMKRHRRQAADRCLSADEFLAVSNECGLAMRAACFLGLNCGYGPSDIFQLPKSVIDFDNPVICWHRGKTEENRVAVLWGETVAALKLWDEFRPANRSKKFFAFKNPSEVSRDFRDALKRAAKLRTGAAFYGCRHTLGTIGRGAGDDSALRVIMGHADDSMLDHYTHEFPVARVKAVSDYVRCWLLGSKP